jgi:hypothetical protein
MDILGGFGNLLGGIGRMVGGEAGDILGKISQGMGAFDNFLDAFNGDQNQATGAGQPSQMQLPGMGGVAAGGGAQDAGGGIGGIFNALGNFIQQLVPLFG